MYYRDLFNVRAQELSMRNKLIEHKEYIKKNGQEIPEIRNGHGRTGHDYVAATDYYSRTLLFSMAPDNMGL